MSETTVAVDALAVSASDGRLSTTVGNLVTTTVGFMELDCWAAPAPVEAAGAGEVAGLTICVVGVVVPAGVAEVLAGVVEAPSGVVVVLAGVVGVALDGGDVPLHCGGHGTTGCCVKVFVVKGQNVWGALPVAPTPCGCEPTSTAVTLHSSAAGPFVLAQNVPLPVESVVPAGTDSVTVCKGSGISTMTETDDASTGLPVAPSER